MNKLYIIEYCGGDWDSEYQKNIFATTQESKAKEYTSKFNNILKKWKKYYSQFEDEDGFLKDEYLKTHLRRWDKIRNIEGCYYYEIEIR